jgi:CHAT domain-containing protein/tetratricopeptide (TPR) repeat protein
MALGLWGTLAVAGGSRAVAASPPPDPFAACRQQFAADPQDYESSYCFYQTALRQRLFKEVARVFEALMQEHPDNFWLPLSFGHVYRETDPDRTEALYRRAADGFRTQRHAGGEILARSNLRNYLFPKGRLKDATAEMERVTAVAAAVDDPLLKGQAWTLEATHVQETGGDLGVAYRLLKQTQRAIFPQGSYRLKRSCLSSLGLVAFRMGRADEALAVFEELDRLAGGEGDAREQAAARYNILNVSSMKESLLPTPGARPRLMAVAERSLESALAARYTVVVLKTHRTIAALLARDSGARAKALDHVQQCLMLSVEARQPHDEAVCSWLEASLLHDTDPDRAQAAERRALAATTRANSRLTEAYSASRHMQLSWDTKTRTDAIRDSLAAIDSIETLRSLQDDADSSAELFSTWTLEYYWFSGRLLRDLQDGDLDLAFSITERLRARSLLDRLERSRQRIDPSLPVAVKRRSLLESIAKVQRGLMDPAIKDDDRRSAHEQLDELERQEEEARRQISVAAHDRHPASPAFANLEAVQSALANNEALLSFQVGIWDTYEGEFGGGSWLIALTRHGRAVYRIPDRAQLAPVVPVFTGLLARSDNVGTPAAVRLYDDILADAVKGLPPEIERLILVPDGPLHRLPFDALRPQLDAAPIASRYEIEIVPSATLWLQWRRNPPSPGNRRALAFADPELEISGDGQAIVRNAVLQQGLSVGRLPYARRESRSLERHLGGVEALVGKQASERALKDRDLRGYDILHFAAHAVADETRPERSAVLLSPGADGEDGLLQAREIEGLDLDGRIVVLSACQTASGAILSGEGVLSLARAFFAAGARAVIGTSWPIRDEDAAVLFDAFYSKLGGGASLSEALSYAKTEAMNAGLPPAAWASLVLLGDGAFRPFPEGRRETPPTLLVVSAVGTGMILLLALAGYRLTRRRFTSM